MFTSILVFLFLCSFLSIILLFNINKELYRIIMRKKKRLQYCKENNNKDKILIIGSGKKKMEGETHLVSLAFSILRPTVCSLWYDRKVKIKDSFLVKSPLSCHGFKRLLCCEFTWSFVKISSITTIISYIIYLFVYHWFVAMVNILLLYH